MLKIIGNGELANIFKDSILTEDVVIFASGVSDSKCTDSMCFIREEELLRNALKKYKNEKIVYFSSCALSSPGYIKNDYYLHKRRVEEVIKTYSSNYYIFRLPQVFGEYNKAKRTLINFFYTAILNNINFTVISDASRYLLHTDDLVILVIKFLEVHGPNHVIDLANPYRYSILEIVEILEEYLNRKASYDIVDKVDQYELNLDRQNEFIESNNIIVGYSKEYLKDKLMK